jgi:NAD(P)-dependent dehydrogenase (short-subunit alcohol dehydrogenase family)
MRTVLLTGAGTGFGLEASMRLAEKGFDVIAAVEIYAQVQTLKRQAAPKASPNRWSSAAREGSYGSPPVRA